MAGHAQVHEAPQTMLWHNLCALNTHNYISSMLQYNLILGQALVQEDSSHKF